MSIAIHLIVRNGEKYLRYCLNSIRTQTYKDFKVLVFDNNSTDSTAKIVEKEYPEFQLYKSADNYGPWPGFSRSLKFSQAKYVVFLSVDVIWDADFLKNLFEFMEKNPDVGAAQGKVLQWHLEQKDSNSHTPSVNASITKTDIVDTAGFEIYRSRRVINRGQGEKDTGQFDKIEEVFAVEGACVFFRREALENSRLRTTKFEFENETYCELSDEDFFWYADDLDLVWRMRLFGWKQYLIPKAIMWHDRSTTKGVTKYWLDYFRRLKIRRQIPIQKRRLDWRNVRLTIIKNDFAINILKDTPYILKRDVMVFSYTLLFEPRVLLEMPILIKLLPKMWRKRREIMRRKKVGSKEIHTWFK